MDIRDSGRPLQPETIMPTLIALLVRDTARLFEVRALAVALPLFVAWGCGGDRSHDGSGNGANTSDSTGDSEGTGNDNAGGKADAGGSSGQNAARSDAGSGSSSARDAGSRPDSAGNSGTPARVADAGTTSAACDETSLNLVGCSCPSGEEKRACYTGPKATRNVGTCRDGSQTCVAGGEFGGTYSDCTGDVLPTATATCVIVPDAGTPDAGKPPSKCMQTSGISGAITLPNGTMFCEDDLGGGFPGGIFGGP
jgi:hypothetical protein